MIPSFNGTEWGSRKIKVTRLRRTGTEPIAVKVLQKLEKTPGALKINVLHKIILQGADNENISAHSMKKLFFKIP